jgi:hypothetical protein
VSCGISRDGDKGGPVGAMAPPKFVGIKISMDEKTKNSKKKVYF